MLDPAQRPVYLMKLVKTVYTFAFLIWTQVYRFEYTEGFIAIWICVVTYYPEMKLPFLSTNPASKIPLTKKLTKPQPMVQRLL
jgi:hypothetical protein